MKIYLKPQILLTFIFLWAILSCHQDSPDPPKPPAPPVEHSLEDSTITKNIGNAGGQISLTNVSTVYFEPNTFNQTIPVKLSRTRDTLIREDMKVTSALFDVKGEMNYEIRINTGKILPDTIVKVEINLPDSFIGKIPTDFGARAFGKLFLDNSDEQEVIFNPLESKYYGTKKTLEVLLVPAYFSSDWTSDQTYEAVISVGISPGVNPSAGRVMGSCNGDVLCPNKDCSSNNISRGYSEVPYIHPVSGTPKPHLGVDFRGVDGVDFVYAAADGEIVYTQSDPNRTGWGNFLIILHQSSTGSFKTLYGHLNTRLVTTGHVSKGQVLGTVGRTGRVTGPHLHFEYIVGGGSAGRAAIAGERIEPLQCLETETEQITIIDGNNQTGHLDEPLTKDLKVRVTKGTSDPVTTNVYFTPENASDIVSSNEVVTDNGYAQVTWTLKGLIGQHKLTASIKDANGATLATAEFLATAAAQLPTLTTIDPSSITSTLAITGGNVTDDGGSPITARGICWSTNPGPTIINNNIVTVNGTGLGTFTGLIDGLTPGETYFARAYATNSAGTNYGNEITFTTDIGEYYWFGSMIMDSHQMTGNCCDIQNQDGIPDCGTGGCQSASRALFSSLSGTGTSIAFTETSSANNVIIYALNVTIPEKDGYSATIPATGDFTISINNYAPDRWGGEGFICNGQVMTNRNAYLNAITFTVTSETPTSRSGTWSGKDVQVSIMHCKEDCSGTWSVSKTPGKLPTADYFPVNP